MVRMAFFTTFTFSSLKSMLRFAISFSSNSMSRLLGDGGRKARSNWSSGRRKECGVQDGRGLRVRVSGDRHGGEQSQGPHLSCLPVPWEAESSNQHLWPQLALNPLSWLLTRPPFFCFSRTLLLLTQGSRARQLCETGQLAHLEQHLPHNLQKLQQYM